MEKWTDDLKTTVFNLMNGLYNTDDYDIPCADMIENEFVSGKECDLLYERIFNARQRIEKRLNTEDEDEDLMEIITLMERVTKILCFKMFDYGRRASWLEQQIHKESKKD